jgi:hopene-associated glycosyltransferase HpnB
MAALDSLWTILAAAGAVVWLGILISPWQPWRNRERFAADEWEVENTDLRQVTVLIPARNEAQFIGMALSALGEQGDGLAVILIDDRSDDGTAEVARRAAPENCNLEIVAGTPLPSGWAGKMWALEQGLAQVKTPLVLLLDADIALAPGALPALIKAKQAKGVALYSLMVALDMRGFWQALLMPAFVYFFKLLYPFHLSNGRSRLIAAGAGGCILTEREILLGIGGFAAIKDAIIDDCSLARAVKNNGGRTWIGLSHSARSVRPYEGLGEIWQMVARSAFTQLRHSLLLLLFCTATFALACGIPPLILIAVPVLAAKLIAATALVFMVIGYLPTLSYYRMPRPLAFTMPLIGMLYLAMTWSSAFDHWRGRRSLWKGRVYSRDLTDKTNKAEQ